MSEHDPTSEDGFEVTFTASFCFIAARDEVEGKSPFEVAALMRHRLTPGDFFIEGAGIELESADRTEFREACFKPIDHDFLAGLFTGDEAVEEDYLLDVPPGDRAVWTPTEDAKSEG